MPRSVLLVVAWLAGCAPGGSDDSAYDVRPGDDGGGGETAGADADSSADLSTDSTDDSSAEAEAEATPSEPTCRYECAGDSACVGVYGAGWVCRESTAATSPRLCLQLCTTDDDCRPGAASDPLMVCRDGACAMRACTAASECGWAGTGAGCRTVDWGVPLTCFRSCSTDTDCAYGSPADILYHCDGGLCAWYCDTDTDCSTAFGSDAYGCRTPSSVPGASCVRGCTSTADCLVGAPSDALAVCR
jgi:hypothetical protein